MQVSGNLKLVRETQQVTDKFQKREFVVQTTEQYPQFITMELQGDKCDIIDSYAEGEEVVVDINLRGRSWVNKDGEEKFFNTIVAWKIQRANSQQQTPAQEYTQTETNPNEMAKSFNQANQPNSFVDGEEEFDDLPF